jgi:hypothetical protein
METMSACIFFLNSGRTSVGSGGCPHLGARLQSQELGCLPGGTYLLSFLDVDVLIFLIVKYISIFDLVIISQNMYKYFC